MTQPTPPPLDQTDIDPPFTQLKRQAEAYRTSTDDHDLVLSVIHCHLVHPFRICSIHRRRDKK